MHSPLRMRLLRHAVIVIRHRVLWRHPAGAHHVRRRLVLRGLHWPILNLVLVHGIALGVVRRRLLMHRVAIRIVVALFHSIALRMLKRFGIIGARMLVVLELRGTSIRQSPEKTKQSKKKNPTFTEFCFGGGVSVPALSR